MKIGFDAKRLFSNLSGLGNYSRSTVELLHQYFPEDSYTLFAPTNDNRAGFTIPEGIDLVTPTALISSTLPSLWRSFFMASDIRAERIDIFHGLSNELPNDIRHSGAKSVVSVHDLIYMRYPNLYSKIDKAIYEYKYRTSCENADMIIAISNQTKEDLISYWNIPEEQIDVVYQGCNPIYYEKASAEKLEEVKRRYHLPDNYILSVGTLEERKNLMLTLNAMVEGNIDMPLVACGKRTPYTDKLWEYAIENGIEKRVFFHHDVIFEDLPAIYQMADVAVYVSLFEGFGIPILESLNSGTPMITAKGGVFPETGGDACLYVGQYDLEDMITSIRSVLDNSDIRSSMIAKGHKYALNFRDDKVATNLHRVYEKMM